MKHGDHIHPLGGLDRVAVTSESTLHKRGLNLEKGNIFGVASAALSLGACAKPVGASYPTPTSGAAVATITIAKSPYLSLGGDTVGFYAFDNDLCEDTDGSGSLGVLLWTTANTVSTEVLADTRIVIRAVTTRSVGTGTGLATTNCSNLIAITPEQGRSYTMRQILFPEQQTCAVEAVDDETGKAPPSLQRLPLVDSCRAVVLRSREA